MSKTFFQEEVLEKLDAGVSYENVYGDLEELVSEGYYERGERTSMLRGLVRVGWLVEVPEPAKQEVTTLSSSGCRTAVTNRDRYDYKIAGRFYVSSSRQE
jgi:hypothetical protein